MKTLKSWLSAFLTWWKGMTEAEAKEAEYTEECERKTIKATRTAEPDNWTNDFNEWGRHINNLIVKK